MSRNEFTFDDNHWKNKPKKLYNVDYYVIEIEL